MLGTSPSVSAAVNLEARSRYQPGRLTRRQSSPLPHTNRTVCRRVSEYGYRDYGPEWGRWANRDPIGEMGGVHLLGFLSNQTIDRSDYIGLARSPEPPWFKEKKTCAEMAARFNDPLPGDDVWNPDDADYHIRDRLKTDKKCKMPLFKCAKCKDTGRGKCGDFSGERNEIDLCNRQEGRTGKEWIKTRMHEMRHASDYCQGGRWNCSTPSGLASLICTEIRANATQFGPSTSQNDSLQQVISRVMGACDPYDLNAPDPNGRLRNWREWFETVIEINFGKIYDTCTSLSDSAPWPTFPPGLLPPPRPPQIRPTL